jgi:serine/threonine protein kinase
MDKADAALIPGMLLAERFILVKSLGIGGLGHVWLAHDAAMDDEPVACKILRKELGENRCALADLKREVLLTRKLRHPNILPVYTFWDSGGHRFITMEYVDGENLSQVLARRGSPFPPGTLLPWLGDVAAALDYAHGQGVLHRDIKPANIMLGPDGRVLLADFGIARGVADATRDEMGEVTQGTVLFMSPEQLAGDALSPKSDQYSLGCTIYELLRGMPPFTGADLVTQIQFKLPEPIPHLNAALNAVLRQALAKEPERRFPSCGRFADAFAENIVQTDAAVPPPPAPPRDGQAEDTVVLKPVPFGYPHVRLGRILVNSGVITLDQLNDALLRQRDTGERLGAILVRLGYVTEEALAELLSRQLHIPAARIDPAECSELARRLDPETCRRLGCLPLRRCDSGLVVALTDPLDLASIACMEELLGESVSPAIVTETGLRRAIAQIHGEMPNT